VRGGRVGLDFVIDRDGAEIRAVATGTGSIEALVYAKHFPTARRH